MTDRALVARALAGAVVIGLLVALLGGAVWIAARGGLGSGRTESPSPAGGGTAAASGSIPASGSNATSSSAPASGSPLPSGSSLASASTGDSSASPAPILDPPTSAGRQVVVSAVVSPFATCTAGGQGTVTTNSEVEPSLVVDPRDASRIVTAWQQDRWSNGAAHGIVAASSIDAGTTWTRTMPSFSACDGNASLPTRVSDPWLAWGPDGTIYLAGLAVTQPAVSAVSVSRSTDGGRTWSTPATVIRSDSTRQFNDKESVTADPARPRVAYVVWDQSGAGESESGQLQGTTGAVMFARTDDAGATWSRPRAILTVAGTPVGNIVSVEPDGSLVDVLVIVPPNGRGTATVTALRSTNAGATWSSAVTIATLAGSSVIGSQPPGVRGGAGLPAVAVDPATGDLLVVWTAAAAGTPGVMLARSSDGGRTFGTPVPLPRGSAAPAFLPSVAATRPGAIGVEFTDLRAGTPGTPFLADRFLLVTTDGGATWQERRLTSSFDLATAPNAGGRFLGDYTGLVATPDSFVSAFAVTTGDDTNPTDLVVRVDPIADSGARLVP